MPFQKMQKLHLRVHQRRQHPPSQPFRRSSNVWSVSIHGCTATDWMNAEKTQLLWLSTAGEQPVACLPVTDEFFLLD